jgi:hypothetical protein
LAVVAGCGKTTVTVTHGSWLGMTTVQSQRLHELVGRLDSLLASRGGTRQAHVAKATTLALGFRRWVDQNPNVDHRPIAVAERSQAVAERLAALLRRPTRAKLIAYTTAVRNANHAIDALRAVARKGLPPGFVSP